MNAQPHLQGRISNRGTFTSLDGTIVAPATFRHAGRAVGSRQHVSLMLGRHEFFGLHKPGGVVKLFRRGRK